MCVTFACVFRTRLQVLDKVKDNHEAITRLAEKQASVGKLEVDETGLGEAHKVDTLSREVMSHLEEKLAVA